MVKKKTYHKGVLETASVLLRMADNDFEYMLKIAETHKDDKPPSRFMAKQYQGVAFGELDTPSLEFLYVAIKSSDIDIHYKIIAKSCLYKKFKANNGLFDGFYDNAEDAISDFILEEIEAMEPYIETIKKPMLKNKIQGKYNERKKRAGIEHKDDERSKEDINGVQSEVRPEDNESSSSGDDESIEEWTDRK